MPGVAEVRVTGGRDKEVRVAVDRYRLDAFGVSLALLQSRLAAENVDIAAGSLEEDERIFQVRGLSRFRTPADVADVVVRYMDGPPDQSGARQAVRVKDLGTVALVDAEIDHLVLVNGVEGVGLSIYKEAGANTVGVSESVHEALEGLHEDLPGVDVHEIADDAGLVTDAPRRLETRRGRRDRAGRRRAGVVPAVARRHLDRCRRGAGVGVRSAVPDDVSRTTA